MREEIARLMALQALDRQLHGVEESLAGIQGRVKELGEETEKSETELQRLTDDDQKALAARTQLERELAEGESHIRNSRMHLTRVRNEKEMLALSHEIETLKENNQRLESEILILMEAAEERAKKIKELAESSAQRRTELVAAEKEIAGRVEELKTSLVKQRIERDQMAAGIDAALFSRYEMIASRRGGIAIALARDGTCQGCRIGIPPQLYNEIQKALAIQSCPNCMRMLYYEEKPAGPEE